MIKIGVCDDNSTLLQKYQKMVDVVSKECDWEIKSYAFNDGEDVLKMLIEDGECLDILFLDILMRKMNGVETAKKIREINSKVIIIFLTSSEEYIFESIGLSAMAYLLKDQLTEDTFKQTLSKAIGIANESKNDVLQFKKSGRMYKLSYHDICFVKIYKGYCYIHHWDGIIYESADASIANELIENGFFQVHEQYVVSLQYIGRIEKDHIILSDQSKNEIPIDKELSKQLKLTFANFMIQKAKGEISNGN
ncbi:LytR/AlgR family response regulator transcription factor [Anaerorhabdus sp.]|uniref:LytR/AlgR family response regulator transcription factor n=1 Tax=Anaerorhabdus sp. TaxID=1872524 RepID=UPI002FC963DC